MLNQKIKLSNPELEGEIYYLTEQEGGRKGYINSGYRGQFFYKGKDWDAPQEFIDKEICNPGETVKVKIRTLSPHFHVGQFLEGQYFEAREGFKTVGRGKITKILRSDFNYWNYESFFMNLPVECKPYDFQNIGGFIADFEYGLSKIHGIKKIKFTKSLSNKNQMLNVECILKDNKIQARPFIDEICKSWEDEIQFKNSFYKTDLKQNENNFKFELIFATYHSMYLTGKIIVNATEK
ncbi:EF-Tu C-terminal domain-related protein [Sphingobacterium bovistauri]|uniref:Translation elongation factor EFTu/EF1A C-terminal domain-containing protein n=1 Tax=Sphingobacterium bovistauri TaxID=2781959 RepID=A0ABS7Z852_9SPHI|nr:hypothetical protein [Sphingobacterium bovistauri]MCA5006373.1 hypothetical protein [Sphingobacterium bovistauri]